MGSNTELFSLLINSNTSSVFFPGDIISGYVFKLTARTLTKNVNITCRGKAVVSLDGVDVNTPSSRLILKGIQYFLPETSKEEYFLHSSVCLDEYISIYDEGAPDNFLSAGDDSAGRPLLFLFQLRLPKLLPPSCHLHYGYIVYDLKFEWEAWKPEVNEWEYKVKHIPISIGPSVNLNEIPFAGEPAEITRHEKFSFFCFNFGSMDLTLGIDKVGYIPGEELHFKIHANNETKYDVEKVTVSLRQERTFYVGDMKKKSVKILASCDGPRVAQGESVSWGDHLIVPEIHWKFFWPCSLIRIAFFLQVRLTTYKNRCHAQETIMENSVNVIIGDIPVEPLAYFRNFGPPLVVADHELTADPDLDAESVWLGIDCLTGGLGVSLPTRSRNRNCHCSSARHRDHTPSYSSVVSASMRSSVRGIESPPPSYHEAIKMCKPLKFGGSHAEDQSNGAAEAFVCGDITANDM